MLEQVEQVPSVAPIGLCFPDHHGPDFPRFANEHRVAEPVHERVEPLGVAGGLDPDRHRGAQRPIELLHRVAIVGELLFEDFARRHVESSDLLLARVQITANECHESSLLLGGQVTVPQPKPSNRGRPFS